MSRKTKNNNMNKRITGLWGKGGIKVSEAEVKSEEKKEVESQPDTEAKDDTLEEPVKKKKREDKNINIEIPTITLKDLGGIEAIIEEILELIALPITHPEIYIHSGIKSPRGILLHGPPGVGKTKLANAIAGELKVPIIIVSAPSVVSGMSGESEKKLRNIFEQVKKNAPCLLFLDEIDAITPKRETAQREMERRIVAQLLTCLDDLSFDKTDNKPVLVIGATNRPDSIDPALRRAGRFDREISIGVPDEKSREKILRVLCKNLRILEEIDFKYLSKNTPGYVGADLEALTSTAGMIAVKRIFNLLKEGKLDFNELVDLTGEENENEMENEMENENGILQDNNITTEDVKEVESKGIETVKENITEIKIVEEVANKETEIIMKEDTKEIETPATESNKEIENVVKEDVKEIEIIEVKQQQQVINTNNNVSNETSLIQQFLQKYPQPLNNQQLNQIYITMEDFKSALKKVQPSSKREGFATVPDVTFDDIGALFNIREELRMSVVEPIQHSELFEKMGISRPSGVLLWGPPGCGKTLLAKAVANQSHSNFISVKGPELLNKYVGESERAIRQVFLRARASAPCIVFFDELDALCSKRDQNQSEVSARVVNTLLTELDGAEGRNNVFIIAATNRPDIIDPAMLRPGRLDKLLYVELPTSAERYEILKTICKKTPMDENIDLKQIAYDSKCEGYSGADLASLVREAAVIALRENINFDIKDSSNLELKLFVQQHHFVKALSKIAASVTLEDKLMFDHLKPRFGSC
ncbi:AAA-domain-containing protein [Neoconidiobolus thromboides FSU 785]|nr:AAA-domain-containing protein [Neoconidiobolus thromboides FSU 785]